MQKLTKKEIETIKTDAKENWEGDLDLAIAAHVHSPGVVLKVGRKVPAWADAELLKNLKDQTAPTAKKSAKKKAAVKRPPKKSV